jgi:spore coat polysaccharide biosynthesis protein SpsF
VVVVDGDDILCDPEAIDRIVRAHREDPADYIFVDGLPLGATGFGLRVDALERVCAIKAESDTEVWDDYLTEANGFRTLRLEAPPELRHPELRLTLDYAVDLELFRAVFAELGAERPFTLGEVVALLRRRPDLAALNAGVREIYAEHLRKSAPARVRSDAAR